MRIACWQAQSPVAGPAGAMVDRMAAVARAARAAGATLLVTPELSVCGYPLAGHDEDAAAVHRTLGRRVAELAAEHGIAVVYGWPEAAGGLLYNAATLVPPGGGTPVTYRKTHLYGDLDRPFFTPGDQPLVQATVDGVTVGLLICYDVEFPELVRLHALAGTQLLLVPTALTAPWEFVARTLVPARAFESQLFIAYVNWTGRRGRLTYCGLSRVVDPHGDVTGAGPGAEELLVVDVDPAEIVRARQTTPYLTDRRPGLYGGRPASDP